ncbi:MAG: hypothetical protein PS018_07740 [bacterium]|nr:hypothetical protein [bacterium]
MSRAWQRSVRASERYGWKFKMHNVIQLRSARPDVSEAETSNDQAVTRPAESIRTVMDTLSRTLDHIRGLCKSLPDGPVRERLEAEQARLAIDLSAVRNAAARLALVETNASTRIG